MGYKDIDIAEATVRDAARERITVTVDTPILKTPGQKIIDEICAKYGITFAQLRGRRGPRALWPRLIPARIETARALRAINLSVTKVGRMMNRNHGTISWYCGKGPNKPQPVHRP